MVKRLVFRGQYKTDERENLAQYLHSKKEYIRQLIDSDKIMTFSVFEWEMNIFLYYECIGDEIAPETILGGDICRYLEEWPGESKKRYWIPMYDIFHYSKPVSVEHWRRKEKVEKARVRLAKLKPEMFSSYIFYHYQYQEEKPCDGYKTGIITIHENLMFFYDELPGVYDTPLYEGKLKTSHTPPNWGEVMEPHFIFWDNDSNEKEIWKSIDPVIVI